MAKGLAQLYALLLAVLRKTRDGKIQWRCTDYNRFQATIGDYCFDIEPEKNFSCPVDAPKQLYPRLYLSVRGKCLIETAVGQSGRRNTVITELNSDCQLLLNDIWDLLHHGEEIDRLMQKLDQLGERKRRKSIS